MAGEKRVSWIGGIACLVVLASCAGTKLVSVWQDPAGHAPLHKIFVIGIMKEQGPRSLLEDEVVRQLKERGTESLVSYPIFSTDTKPDREVVLAKVRERGADSILVVRFLKKDIGTTQTPVAVYGVPQGFDMGWDAYYSGYDATQYGLRDISYDFDVVIMETTLYDVATKKPLWSALSQTRYQGGVLDQIKPFTTVIVKRLSHEKFIQ